MCRNGENVTSCSSPTSSRPRGHLTQQPTQNMYRAESLGIVTPGPIKNSESQGFEPQWPLHLWQNLQSSISPDKFLGKWWVSFSFLFFFFGLFAAATYLNYFGKGWECWFNPSTFGLPLHPNKYWDAPRPDVINVLNWGAGTKGKMGLSLSESCSLGLSVYFLKSSGSQMLLTWDLTTCFFVRRHSSQLFGAHVRYRAGSRNAKAESEWGQMKEQANNCVFILFKLLLAFGELKAVLWGRFTDRMFPALLNRPFHFWVSCVLLQFLWTRQLVARSRWGGCLCSVDL